MFEWKTISYPTEKREWIEWERISKRFVESIWVECHFNKTYLI